jgi:hypothetical protein
MHVRDTFERILTTGDVQQFRAIPKDRHADVTGHDGSFLSWDRPHYRDDAIAAKCDAPP